MSPAPNDPDLIQILLVEDSETDVDLLREVMEDSRIHNHLSVVRDGVEAMAYLRRQGQYADAPRPDLVLLDLNMPRKDGREVLDEMKSDPDLLHIPVTVLTSSRAEQDIAKAYARHANCYVKKPLGLDEFSEIVRAVEGFWFSVVKLPPKG